MQVYKRTLQMNTRWPKFHVPNILIFQYSILLQYSNVPFWVDGSARQINIYIYIYIMYQDQAQLSNMRPTWTNLELYNTQDNDKKFFQLLLSRKLRSNGMIWHPATLPETGMGGIALPSRNQMIHNTYISCTRNRIAISSRLCEQ